MDRRNETNKECYKVDNKKYLEIMNYVHGIKEAEKVDNGAGIDALFDCSQGIVCFAKLPNSNEGNIIYDKNLKFSDDVKLNAKLISGFERKLKS
jgi:hypothetical protein